MADLMPNLSGVAGAIAAAIALPWIVRTVRPSAATIGGKGVLEYGRPMKVMAVIFWIGWMGFLVAALFAPTKDRVIAFTVVCGFLLLIVSLHLEFFGVRVTFDDVGIRTRSPWRPKREIPWSATNRVWFSQALQWYVVQTVGYGRIRLHIYLSGIESLLSELEARGVPVVRRTGT